MTTVDVTDRIAAGDLAILTPSFERSLRAANKAEKTVRTYLDALALLTTFLGEKGMPTAVGAIRREHVEAFQQDLIQRGQRPATVSNRYRALKIFWGWAIEEGEIKDSPMQHMTPPIVPEEPPAIVSEEHLQRLLKVTQGNGFEERRDHAIIMLFLDSGMRLGELAHLGVADVDFQSRTAVVLGKGRRPRACPFGHKTAKALDRYLRARAAHREGSSAALWLGLAGPMTDSGIVQVVRRRCVEAGIPKFNVHRLRHTWAHQWLASDGGEQNLMALAGWRSRTMLGRYGASAAAQRARAAHDKLSFGDRL